MVASTPITQHPLVCGGCNIVVVYVQPSACGCVYHICPCALPTPCSISPVPFVNCSTCSYVYSVTGFAFSAPIGVVLHPARANMPHATRAVSNLYSRSPRPIGVPLSSSVRAIGTHSQIPELGEHTCTLHTPRVVFGRNSNHHTCGRFSEVGVTGGESGLLKHANRQNESWLMRVLYHTSCRRQYRCIFFLLNPFTPLMFKSTLTG